MRWHDPSFINVEFYLSQLFHSSLSLSSRGCLVYLCFLPQGQHHLRIWAYWYFSLQSWFQFVLRPAHFRRCTQFSSVAQSCPTLCDPMNHSTQGLPVHHQFPEFPQTHVHQVSDAIQPSHPLSSLLSLACKRMWSASPICMNVGEY